MTTTTDLSAQCDRLRKARETAQEISDRLFAASDQGLLQERFTGPLLARLDEIDDGIVSALLTIGDYIRDTANEAELRPMPVLRHVRT